MHRILSPVLALGLVWGSPCWAQAARPIDAEVAAVQATTRKLNAYVALLNGTLRASESIARYANWVDMKGGPTGRERIIYGLYGLYDVRKDVEAARAATALPPAMPELDAAMPPYIAAYEALAPTITRAEGYYDRQDYKADAMAEGKALHARLAPAAEAYLRERAKVDALVAVEKARSDAAELALIETREGRKARWHLTHVMIGAREIIALLPTEKKPVVAMGPFDETLARFAASVRGLDDYAAAEPGAFSAFESRPRAPGPAAGVPRQARQGQGRRPARGGGRPDVDRERLQHDDLAGADGPFRQNLTPAGTMPDGAAADRGSA